MQDLADRLVLCMVTPSFHLAFILSVPKTYWHVIRLLLTTEIILADYNPQPGYDAQKTSHSACFR